MTDLIPRINFSGIASKSKPYTSKVGEYYSYNWSKVIRHSYTYRRMTCNTQRTKELPGKYQYVQHDFEKKLPKMQCNIRYIAFSVHFFLQKSWKFW